MSLGLCGAISAPTLLFEQSDPLFRRVWGQRYMTGVGDIEIWGGGGGGGLLLSLLTSQRLVVFLRII